MVVVGGAWIYLQDTTLPAVNDGAINIYIHFVAPSAGFISVVLLCWIHICTPLMGSVRVVSKALLNRVLVQ